MLNYDESGKIVSWSADVGMLESATNKYTNKYPQLDKEFALGFNVSRAMIEDNKIYTCTKCIPLNEEPMLTDMQKLVLDSMIQNDETVETMIFVLFDRTYDDTASKYLHLKSLRELIEVYINE